MEHPTNELHYLKRKRARERGNATRFITVINGFSETSSLDDYQHYQGRLQDTLNKLLTLVDAIHDLLSDLEFYSNSATCEEFIDSVNAHCC